MFPSGKAFARNLWLWFSQKLSNTMDVILPMLRMDKALAEAPKYQYSALPDNHSIRILILYPGAPDEPLEGRLELLNVNFDFTDYETLSYMWGEPIRRHEIICAGHRLPLTVSLHDALVRLRRPDRPRWLWADQVCINQDDREERSQQVQFMNRIYKNATHVLVWLGPDDQATAKVAFMLVNDLDEIFQNEEKHEKFRIEYTEHLHDQSKEMWVPLMKLTNLPWEIGTRAPATLFWGAEEIDWDLLHSVCFKLTDYYHLRKDFHIQTDLIKYAYQRFIEPPLTSRHANRFSFIYELQRARHLQVSDPRDRVFALLSHFSVYQGNKQIEELRADYKKTTEQVYVDVAVRALEGDTSLVALAAIQHPNLPSGKEAPNPTSGTNRVVDEKTLPSWVPNWDIGNQAYLLSEPISDHCAHGTSVRVVQVNQSTLVLSARGLKIDTIEALSAPMSQREFHINASGKASAFETLWHNICGKDAFDLEEKYVTGESAFFAYAQTLANGCVSTSSRDHRNYHDIPKSEWLANGAAYLTKTLGRSDKVTSAMWKAAFGGDYFKWSRAANGATNHRVFARTANGYYVLAPKVVEAGDIVCVLFGGKMPFVLRPWGIHYLLVGECYTHGK
ncbi:Heterokaryon incompatibility protein [Hyphodiscus hymeniophilus]|uniref:Heterokaryon incompatibility protein n=1 Tax=Hyphodiscus hymeniophilus TaxID=353542 RepID=A0A9P7AUQ5_9HELO|nr:Heterokaryon incompatibility protein [Hyphodiscus hymeniophilus]